MTKNKESTRFYSERQEKAVAKALGGTVNSNSGAGLFIKGDVVVYDASVLIECKTATTEKQSFSIKKDWIYKNAKECKDMHLINSVICFDFGGLSDERYYVINEKLMQYLTEKLKQEYIDV